MGLALADDSLQLLECRGDPRAMGLVQGRVLRAAVRERIASSGALRLLRLPRLACALRPFASGPVLGAGPGREIVRHYPHLCERSQGLAAGAKVSAPALIQLFVRAASGGAPDDPLSLEASVAVRRDASGAELTRTLPERAGAGSAWLVRRSRPDVGFASVELTLPWLASSVAGVNEAGLAVALSPGSACEGSVPVVPTSSPPAALLVQECLQRFEDLGAALEWSLKRPAAGELCLMLADASGEAAAVEFSGSRRRVLRAEAGGLHARGRVLRKATAHETGSARAGETGAPGDDPSVRVEPSLRRLRIRARGGGPEREFPVAGK